MTEQLHLLGEVAEIDDRITLTTTADDTAIELGHELIERLWVEHPEVAATERVRFETAVIEILANVVEHAFGDSLDDPPPAPADGSEPLREVAVTVAARDGCVHAVLSDNGNPPSVDLSGISMPDDDAVSGRGLAMAEIVTSQMSVHRIGEQNVWRLRCDPE